MTTTLMLEAAIAQHLSRLVYPFPSLRTGPARSLPLAGRSTQRAALSRYSVGSGSEGCSGSASPASASSGAALPSSEEGGGSAGAAGASSGGAGVGPSGGRGG